jgi:hypothetical protein
MLAGASGEDLYASAYGTIDGLDSNVIVAEIEDDIILLIINNLSYLIIYHVIFKASFYCGYRFKRAWPLYFIESVLGRAKNCQQTLRQ